MSDLKLSYYNCHMLPLSDLINIRFYKCQILQLSDLTNVRSYNCQILQLSALTTVRSYNYHILQLLNLTNIRSFHSQILQLSDVATVRSYNCQLLQRSNLIPVRFYNCQLIYPSDIKLSDLTTVRSYNCQLLPLSDLMTQILQLSEQIQKIIGRGLYQARSMIYQYTYNRISTHVVLLSRCKISKCGDLDLNKGWRKNADRHLTRKTTSLYVCIICVMLSLNCISHIHKYVLRLTKVFTASEEFEYTKGVNL
jgi:hypothetical protein